MKLATALVFAAMALTATHAKECTQAQLAPLESRPELQAFSDACKGVDFMKYGSAQGVCSQTKCVSALVAALKIFPDCTVDGSNPKTIYQGIEDGCKKAGVPVVQTSAASSAGASTAASAVAVAAAVLIYGRA